LFFPITRSTVIATIAFICRFLLPWIAALEKTLRAVSP
jgi:hypothetical protein